MQVRTKRSARTDISTVFLGAAFLAGILAQGSEISLAAEPDTGVEARAAVVAVGDPRPFDEVFEAIQSVPRFKDEYETTAAFELRQREALSSIQQQYLIATPIDMEYVKYDADAQTLVVVTYALANTGFSSDEFAAMFGYGSELKKNGIEVDYSPLIGGGNIAWPLPRESRDIGSYVGQNAFGGNQDVVKQVEESRGVFEREGAYEANIWSAKEPPYDERNQPRAFELTATPAEAKSFKEGGLRAAFLVAPMSPYYATGTTRFSPTVSAPYDRTTNVRYIVGDIRAVALFNAKGELLATRATQ